MKNSCCNWREGQPNVSMKLELEKGEISINEIRRIEKEARTFFENHGISLRVHSADNGVELEFISYKKVDLKQELEL